MENAPGPTLDVTPTPESIGIDEYEVLAVETIHQKYGVKAKDPEQARARLRRYFTDPEVFAADVVRPIDEGERVRWLLRGEKRGKGK